MTSSPNSPHTVESGHESGPWEYDSLNGFVFHRRDPLTRYVIAQMESSNDANAHLIAAAPDLIKALQDCLDRFVEAFPAAAEYEPIKRGYAAIRRTTGEN